MDDKDLETMTRLQALVFLTLREMSVEDRKDIIREFCGYCGAEDSGCHCMNDE